MPWFQTFCDLTEATSGRLAPSSPGRGTMLSARWGPEERLECLSSNEDVLSANRCPELFGKRRCLRDSILVELEPVLRVYPGLSRTMNEA